MVAPVNRCNYSFFKTVVKMPTDGVLSAVRYAKDPRRLAQVNGKDSMNGMIKKRLGEHFYWTCD